MQDSKFTNFPSLIEEDEFATTRVMPLGELPKQTRIDHEMGIIRTHHPRIASAIDVFWGHRDCVEYLQELITNGGDGFGHARVGFKHDVLAALINLSALHDIKSR